MVTQTKQMVVATPVLEEALQRAQVLIVEGKRWHVLAPRPYRAQGDWGIEEVKALVNCPIIDVSRVPAELDETMGAVIRGCVDVNAGVFNRAGLLTGLEAIGAVVVQ